MTIARLPHPIFAMLWLAWSVYMIVCVWLATGVADVILWGSWAAIEGAAAALNTGMRDTQSELATWVHRHLAKGPVADIPHRGWNALLFIPYIGLIGLNVFQLFQGRGLLMESFGVAFVVMICVGIWDHWHAPQVWG